jgi:DHA1 family bicyclomycin/chloramphenicol resistance-like MFS transporter
VLLVLSLVVAPGWGLAGFVVPLLLFTAALGLVMPVLSSTALQDHSVRAGTAASLLGSAQMVSGAVAAPLLGLLGAREPLTVAAFMAAGTLVAAVVAHRAAPA